MALTNYTYSISTDFPSALVDSSRLTLEIGQSAIVTALDHIDTAGDAVDIWFKDALSGGDQTILDGIVAIHSGLPLSNSLSSSLIVSGYCATSNTTRTSVFATAYTEPASAAQRSVSSSSASDTAAGTGARTVRITYYDDTMTGPYAEVVVLNGTSAVNTTATNIRFIAGLEVLTAGSGGNNAGTITLFGSTAGGGGTVGTIAINDNKTNWCHRYVGSATSMYLLQVICSNQGASAGMLTVLQNTPTVANSTDYVIIPQVRIPAGDLKEVSFASPIQVSGPARVQLQIKQDAASGTNSWFAGFAYQEV